MEILFPVSTKLKYKRVNSNYYSGLLQLKYKYSKRHSGNKFRINIPFLCNYFNRSKTVIWYHLYQLQKKNLISISIQKKKVYIIFKENSKMGNYYNKVRLIKQQVQELFDMWCKVLGKINLVIPKTCSPEMFGMFKQLAKEYDLELVKSSICYFYIFYPQVFKQYKLSATLPKFIDFYRKRADIINDVNQNKFDYRSYVNS